MHNLHFVKVRANSGEEACRVADNLLIDFGTENNWRAFCGAVSEDNEIYNADDGRYEPKDTDYQSIEAINNAVNKWTKNSFYGEIAKEKFEKGETDLSQWDSHELWSLSKLAEQLSEAHSYRDRPFDLMKGDTFFAYKYDECGLTNMVYDTYEDDDEAMGKTKEKIWVVFVDMHS
jgi:hypothetical protein